MIYFPNNTKYIIIILPRCLACKSEKQQDLQCESRAKKGSKFCGKHIKGKYIYNTNMTTKIKNRGTGAWRR